MSRFVWMPLVLVLFLAGCGGDSVPDVPPDLTVLTPTWAPEPTASPAGTVVPAGGPPAAVAVNGSLTAVAVRSGLVIFNAAGVRLASVPTDDPPQAVVALPDGGFRAVAGSAVVTVGPLPPAVTAATSPAAAPTAVTLWRLPAAAYALAVHPSGWTAVAVTTFGDVIILSATGETIRTLDVGGNPGGLAVAGDLLAVLDKSVTSLTVYDVTSGARKEGLRAGDGAVSVTTDATGRFFVIDARDGELLVFETGPLILRQRFPVPGLPFASAYDPTRDPLWVAVTERNEVVGYNLSGGTPREVARHPTPRLPVAVAVDPATGALAVAGSAEGLVQRISP